MEGFCAPQAWIHLPGLLTTPLSLGLKAFLPVSCNWEIAQITGRLKTLKLYSLQRRRERHITIYTWKILEVVSNPTSRNMISAQHRRRFGRTYCRKTVEGISQNLMSLHVNSFTYEGPTPKMLTHHRQQRPASNTMPHQITLPDPEQKNNVQRRTPKLSLMIDVWTRLGKTHTTHHHNTPHTTSSQHHTHHHNTPRDSFLSPHCAAK